MKHFFLFFFITASSNAACEEIKNDISKLIETVEQIEKNVPFSKLQCAEGNSSHQTSGLTSSFFEKGANCTKFIQKNGEYGDHGKIVFNAIKELGPQSHMVADSIPGMDEDPFACPKWKQLNYETRLRFWVWTFAAIAWDESKCRPNERNPKGTGGPVVGLLQMEESASKRAWRGKNCKATDILPPENNLRCGVDIMAELMRGKDGVYKGSGKIWPTNSYWEKLRPHANRNGPTASAKMIQEFHDCK